MQIFVRILIVVSSYSVLQHFGNDEYEFSSRYLTIYFMMRVKNLASSYQYKGGLHYTVHILVLFPSPTDIVHKFTLRSYDTYSSLPAETNFHRRIAVCG